jgi:septum formation protein
MMNFILASGSPRRRELLAKAGYEFQVIIPDVSEEIYPEEGPGELVSRLAYEKAAHVAASHSEAVVLAADTVVFFEGEILGKPSSKHEAYEMLTRLSDKEHTVFTGFSIVHERTFTRFDSSQVKLRKLLPAEIEWYVATGEPLDKAGSYGIQERGGQFVESIVGSYTTIVGLNVSAVSVALQDYGIKVQHLVEAQ